MMSLNSMMGDRLPNYPGQAELLTREQTSWLQTTSWESCCVTMDGVKVVVGQAKLCHNSVAGCTTGQTHSWCPRKANRDSRVGMSQSTQTFLGKTMCPQAHGSFWKKKKMDSGGLGSSSTK